MLYLHKYKEKRNRNHDIECYEYYEVEIGVLQFHSAYKRAATKL